MSTTDTLPNSVYESLEANIAGDVFGAGDEGYDDARQAFFLGVEQRPSVVVLPESTVDVIRAVVFARSHGMRIAPQSTGHGAMPVESMEGAMLLKTSRMRHVDIYPATRIARAEAGAWWQDVTVPAAEHGLAALAGSSPNVGVAGYTLGGGMGFLARRHGLAANSVTAVELVTVDGRLARADADHEPDLFWAVRGGGGNVGVVTALEMALLPIPDLYAGDLFFPIERSSEVLRAWLEWIETVPDEVTSIARILRVPDFPVVPEAMRGRAFVLVEAACIADAAAGAALLAPLRELGPEQDTVAMIPAPLLQTLHMDPDEPVDGEVEGALLSDFTEEAIDAVLSLVGPNVDTPLASLEIRQLGGALAREVPGAGAQPKLDAKFAMFAGGPTETPELRGALRAEAQALQDVLAPWRASHDYYNFTESPSDADAVLPPDTYRRLQEIKARYDPDQVLISAHPVRPAPAPAA